MLKNMTRLLMVLCIVVLVTGCASTRAATPGQTSTKKKIETRFYVEDRPRVDQEMEGNFGYISGTPQPEDRSQYRKTRRVYVLEVVQNVPEALEMNDAVIEPYVPAPAATLPPPQRRAAPAPQPIVIPDLDDVRVAPQEEQFENYVIQEGDTLQKISKKFYGSYSQWTKIYDANKDVLTDPNRIKPGILIRVPLSGSSAPVENLK